MTDFQSLVSYKIERALKKLGLACRPRRGYHLSFERPLSCLWLTVTSLDVKENGHIFIGTFSLEPCSAEESVIGDVMYLSVYLVWQSPQVCWVLISTGTSGSEISFITSSYLPSRAHSAHSQPQGDVSWLTWTHTQRQRGKKSSCRNVVVTRI